MIEKEIVRYIPRVSRGFPQTVPLHEIVNAIPYKLKTGGQLAAATVLTEKFNEEGDNLHVS